MMPNTDADFLRRLGDRLVRTARDYSSQITHGMVLELATARRLKAIADDLESEQSWPMANEEAKFNG